MQKATVVTVQIPENDKRLEQLHMAAECAAALLLTVASVLLLAPCLTGSGMQTPVLAAGGCACILTAALYLIKKTKRFAAAIPVGAALLLLLISPSAAAEGFSRSVNGLLTLWNVKYEDAVPLLGQGMTVTSVQTFSIAAAILTGTLMWYAVKRRAAVSIGIWSAVLLALAQFFGYLKAASFGILFIGWLSLVLLWSCGRMRAVQTLWLAAAAALIAVLSAALPENAAAGAAGFSRAALQAAERFRYGEDLLPQGKLPDAAQMHKKTEPALSVQTDSADTMYLRGFTGGRYENGEWKELPRSAYRGEKEGMFAWLSESGFSPQAQYGQYLAAGENENDAKATVAVQNIGADRRYVYLPYMCGLSDEVRDTSDDASTSASGIRGCSAYMFRGETNLLPSELLHIDAWVTDPQTERQEAYLAAEKVYRTFAYENYLDTDSEAADVIRDLFWPAGTQWDTEEHDFTLYEATDHIRTVLESTVQYTKTPAKLPADTEPLQWFLLEAKAGNAPFFASVTVLAFREAGFPARYAEGYLLREEAVGADGSAQLTSQDGHAWAEVYLDGVSWLPVDTTPGCYYDAYSLQQMLTRPQEDAQTAQLDRESGEDAQEITGSDGIASGQQEEHRGSRFTLLTAAGILTCVLLILLLAFLIACIVRVICWLRFRRAYRAATGIQRTELLFERIRQRIQRYGIDCSLGSGERETDRALAEKLFCMGEGDYIRVHRLAEKAIYGQIVLQAYEQRVLESFYGKLVSQLYRKDRWRRSGKKKSKKRR